MKLNDKVLTLNDTTLVVHSVELFKDQRGVTAKISASNHTVSVLFDGYTTIIHMTGTQKLKAKGDQKAVIKLWFILYPSPLPHTCGVI